MLNLCFSILLPLFLLLSICPSVEASIRLHLVSLSLSSSSSNFLPLFISVSKSLALPLCLFSQSALDRCLQNNSISVDFPASSWQPRPCSIYSIPSGLLPPHARGGGKCVHLSSTFPSLFRPRGKPIKINARGTGAGSLFTPRYCHFHTGPLGGNSSQ